MTDEEAAADYHVNRDRLGEIFGGEVAEFEFVPGATTTLTVRLRRGDVAVLEKVALARGKKLSTFVREAALAVARNPDAGGRDTRAARTIELATRGASG